MTRISAYSYQADLVCEDCIQNIAVEAIGYAAVGDMFYYQNNWVPTQTILEKWARKLHIDMYDEYTYDSDVFPKAVFDNQLSEGDTCGNCGKEL